MRGDADTKGCGDKMVIVATWTGDTNMVKERNSPIHARIDFYIASRMFNSEPIASANPGEIEHLAVRRLGSSQTGKKSEGWRQRHPNSLTVNGGR